MKPAKHIEKLYDSLHKMNMDKHIDRPDKYMAIKDIEIAVYKLQKAFEQELEDK